MKRGLLSGMLLFILIGLCFSGGTQEGVTKPYVLKWGSIEAVGGIQGEVMKWMMSEVETRSNGRLKIDYYPANQLGNTDEQIDGVIAGTIDVLPLGCNLVGNLGEKWAIDSIPFIFANLDERKKYNESELNISRHEQMLETHGIRTIGYNWYRTPHVLVSTKKILLPSDLIGFKMRVPGARAQFIAWSELGASPVTVPWGDVYLALRQGVAQGVSVPFEMIPETKFYEVANYVSMLTTEWSYENVMMNEKRYQNLPEDLRKILLDVLEEGGDMYTKISFNNFDSAKQFLVDQGVEIIEVKVSDFIDVLSTLPDKLEAEKIISKSVIQEVKDFLK